MYVADIDISVRNSVLHAEPFSRRLAMFLFLHFFEKGVYECYVGVF